MPWYVFVKMLFHLSKLDGENNRIPFVTSLVISLLLPGTCHQSRGILSSGFIRADGVEISKLDQLKNQNHI